MKLITFLKTKFIAFLLAAACAFILASVFNTQFVLQELIAIGVNIPFETRLGMTGKDLLGLLPGYGSIIFIGLALGFGLINILIKPFRRFIADQQIETWKYPLAGALSFAAMLALMYPLLEITLIAGARSNLGVAFQCLAGFIAGMVYTRVVSRLTAAV